MTKKEFFAAGVSHTMFANQGLRAACAAVDRTFRILAESESSQRVETEIATVGAVAALVGAQKVVELETWLAKKAKQPVAGRAKKIPRPLALADGKLATPSGRNGGEKEVMLCSA